MSPTKVFLWSVAAVFSLALFLIFVMWIMPVWRVWNAQKNGEAVLAQAESARQVLVQQALAEKAAAVHRAEAIAIVGKAAKEFPEYRAQEFIGAFAHALEAGRVNQIIYVPTEANIPILEAGKR